ncbi:unnamed protein product, partial [Iphiclides podalirius]
MRSTEPHHIWVPGGDRRGRKKTISDPSDFRVPKSASDPSEWGMLASSDHEVFGSKADLQLHTQIHLREAKPYRCTQCPKAFANSSYLAQHSRIHLGIKPYRCEICQRKFTQLSHLQQHIRTHTGDKPYRCTQIGCTKAFSQLSNLQSHSRCHQTDKPFKCNSCYKCFTHEKDLLEHIPKHKESKHLKTHICQYCGKSYTQETYLSKHMNKHAERADKRPPISALGLSGLNRSLAAAAPTAAPFGEHPYWPKVSPDSAAHMSDEGYHQHRDGEDHHEQLQQQRALFQHEAQDDRIQPPVSSASSAFTPINSMAPPERALAPRRPPHAAVPLRPAPLPAGQAAAQLLPQPADIAAPDQELRPPAVGAAAGGPHPAPLPRAQRQTISNGRLALRSVGAPYVLALTTVVVYVIRTGIPCLEAASAVQKFTVRLSATKLLRFGADASAAMG